MNNKLYHEILNLSLLIFDDKDYKKLVLLCQKKEYNKIRLMCSDRIDYLNIVNEFDNKNVAQVQLDYCNKLEDIFTDLYINDLTKIN